MSIEITMRHSDVRIESLKEYAELRMQKLAAKGLGIVITDHNVRETLSVVNRAYLVYEGRLLREGSSHELVSDPEVREKYLGENFRM